MMISTGAPFLLTARTLTAAVTHVDEGTFTLCGTRIGETWAGQYDEGIDRGMPTCKRCAARVASLPVACIDEGVRTVRPVLSTRNVKGQEVTDVAVNGEIVGTVVPVADDTSDFYGRRAAGEIVAPRFSSHADAVAYVIGGDRSELCARAGTDTTGSCIRAAGHEGAHLDTSRYTWTTIRWAHGSIRKFSPWETIPTDEVPTGTADDVAAFSRDLAATLLSPRSWSERAADELPRFLADERAESMRRHPAGKGRTPLLASAQNMAREATAVPVGFARWADPITGETVRAVPNLIPVP